MDPNFTKDLNLGKQHVHKNCNVVFYRPVLHNMSLGAEDGSTVLESRLVCDSLSALPNMGAREFPQPPPPPHTGSRALKQRT